uniref:Uncharacterized protein n=1 Tax=Eptatretus burgeri TaxID=7764 RepID=A0A8C4NLI2_EPTBU
MQKATQRGSLMGCSINISNTSDMEAVTSRKLVKGHAYSVTGVDEVHYNGQTVRLVRTRNPWGQVEWTGAWSDSSALWDGVYESERDRLQVDFEDGEFWMSFDDWLRQYSRLEICNLTPDTLDDDSLKHWHSITYPGSWVKGSSAGGCRNYPNSFWSNPQYRLRLEEEDDDPEDGEDGCTFVLGLMQKNRRKEKRHGIEMQTIGFAIYEIPKEFVGQPQVKMSKDFFLYHASAARSETFVNTREVSQRFRLPAGEYLVIPSTFEPNHELDFVVRVFSEKLNPTDVMDDEVEIKPPEVSEDDDDIDPSFVAIFEKLAGPDGEISPKELQNILARILRKHGNIKTDGFSLDACRNIVALLDKDCSGKLGLKEFNFFWKRIKTWQQIYKQFDMDNSGAFNSFEMRLALKEAGYQLNDKLTEIIISRYRDDDMTIDFDNFICCLVRLEAMSSMFRVMDQGGEGRIHLNLAQVK